MSCLPSVAADRAAKCPFAILLQHHCPLPPQLREVQQRHRREQQQQAAGKFAAGNGAGAGAAAAAAQPAGQPARAALPSQGTVLAESLRQRLGVPQEATQRTADELMDELFELEQQQQQQQQQQQRQAGVHPRPQPQHLQPQLRQPLAGQQGQVEEAQAGPKRPRTDPAAAAHPPPGPRPASTADASGLEPTQPAAEQPAAAGAAGAAAAVKPAAAGPAPAQPASLASCFVPHRRVAAFVWGVVRAIVPAALLGDCHNQRVLRAAIG